MICDNEINNINSDRLMVSDIYPSENRSKVIIYENNDLDILSEVIMIIGGVVKFSPYSGFSTTGWAASGTKGTVRNQTIKYRVT